MVFKQHRGFQILAWQAKEKLVNTIEHQQGAKTDSEHRQRAGINLVKKPFDYVIHSLRCVIA